MWAPQNKNRPVPPAGFRHRVARAGKNLQPLIVKLEQQLQGKLNLTRVPVCVQSCDLARCVRPAWQRDFNRTARIGNSRSVGVGVSDARSRRGVQVYLVEQVKYLSPELQP